MEDSRSFRLPWYRRLALSFQTMGQLIGAIRRGPFWWLLPFFVVLAILGCLLILVQAIPGAAPFVYAVF